MKTTAMLMTFTLLNLSQQGNNCDYEDKGEANDFYLA
jgi:hypothetical protein